MRVPEPSEGWNASPRVANRRPVDPEGRKGMIRMATKPVKQAETTERTEEPADSPILDSLTAPVRKMVARGKERGYVTYDELNKALPSDEVNSEQIEDTMTMLSEMGINVIENEDSEETTSEEKPEAAPAATAATVGEDDLGRTDDPVRMYLREMGSVELLSREGEIAIAKRIEAGRQAMIGGICESPLAMRAIIEWRDALHEGTMLLRDVIDLEATYGGGPEAAAGRAEAAKAADADSGDGAGAEKSEGDGAEKSEGDEDFDEGNVSLSAMELAVRPPGDRDLRRDCCRLQEIPASPGHPPGARPKERDADRLPRPDATTSSSAILWSSCRVSASTTIASKRRWTSSMASTAA